MYNNKIVIAAAMFILGGVGGYILNNNSRDTSLFQSQNAVPSGMYRMPDGSMMGNGGGMSDRNGTGHMMTMMVSSEREFIEEMIPHHQEAVDTANEVIARGGTTPEIKKLVENIVIAQEKEIADMKEWYEKWFGTPYQNVGDYVPMMRDLSTLRGEALDRTFLEDMIMHHMGAIMMAQSVQPYIEHPEINSLSKAIISTQSDEIRLMQQLLGGI